MKDYLNSDERKQVISALHLMTDAMMLVDGNTLNKDEKANLKRGFTFIKKSIESIKDRLNPSALKALQKDSLKSRIYLDIYNATEEYAKKKESDCEASYEENKDYFKLVELILFYNCQNCNKKCTSCEIYHEFEEKSIPEFSGEEDMGNCKYAYRSKVD